MSINPMRSDSLMEILHFFLVSFLKDVFPFVKIETSIQVYLYCYISGFHGLIQAISVRSRMY